MILVTGATGYVGRAVVSRLASHGHDVVAMVRDVALASRRLPAGVARRVADYDDMSAVKTALAGIEDLVLISSDGEASAVMRHHRNVIDAASASGVRHIVFTSIVDTDERSPFYFSPVYRDAERRLVACGVPSTIVRCGLYSDFMLEHWLAPSRTLGALALPAGDGRVAPISRDDVAAAIAAVATEPNRSCNGYTLTGDRALDFGEIVFAYSETLAKPVRYRPCDVDDYLASASAHLDAPWLLAFSSLCASIAEGRYNQVSDDFAAITGRDPESFRDFLLRAATGIL
jgi:NAD(P)H dehydrogenase (quinone)